MKQSEIENMSVGEKLQAMEALWNALDDDIAVPELHESTLQKRLKLSESGQVGYMTLDEVKKRKINGR